jgi:hypothetical protein
VLNMALRRRVFHPDEIEILNGLCIDDFGHLTGRTMRK